MNYYALNDELVSADVQPEGAIVLSEQQYLDAFEAKMAGREALVIDGELVIRDKAPTHEHEWIDGEWAKPEPEAPELTIEEKRIAKRAAISEKRWQVETGGITVTIGEDAIPVSTARGDDREALHITFSAINAGLRQDGAVFKFADEVPRAMSNADMLAIVAAALGHVQACFDHEAPLLAAVAAAEDDAALDAIDVETGWPGQ